MSCLSLSFFAGGDGNGGRSTGGRDWDKRDWGAEAEVKAKAAFRGPQKSRTNDDYTLALISALISFRAAR